MGRDIQEVIRYLTGKRVAIVGNAQSIFGQNNDIDSYDVVIRFNKGFITDPQAQGTKTSIVIMACNLTLEEKASYKAEYYINRSSQTQSGDYTISDEYRKRLKQRIGKQPTSGFMAINLCLDAKAKEIALYGFDWEKTKTFYNPDDYVTKHDYKTEEAIVREMAKNNILSIN